MKSTFTVLAKPRNCYIVVCKQFKSAPQKILYFVLIFTIVYLLIEIRSFKSFTIKHSNSSYFFRINYQDANNFASMSPQANESKEKSENLNDFDPQIETIFNDSRYKSSVKKQFFKISNSAGSSEKENLHKKTFAEMFINSTIGNSHQSNEQLTAVRPTAFYEISHAKEIVRSINIVTSSPHDSTRDKFDETKSSNESVTPPPLKSHRINIWEKLKAEFNRKQDTISKTTLYNYKWERKRLYTEVEEYWKDVVNGSYYTEHVPLMPKQSRSIIIVTNYRSGSTFLGQLFNQHPDVFYIFEPLYPFGNNITTYMDLKTAFLSRYAKCDFPPITHVFDHVAEPNWNTTVGIECLYNNFCFRDKMKNLCQREYCNIPKKFCDFCGPVHLHRAMNICRRKKMSVIKIIRFGDITRLKTIIEDSSVNAKIIYLVRDPRGIASSRLKIHSLRLTRNTNILCSMFRSNLQNLIEQKKSSNEDSWLKKKALIVRYEDLALNPIIVAKRIFRFSGLRFDQSVKEWIKLNTKISTSFNSTFRPFSTDRNSVSAMQSWRKHLTLKQTKIIQSLCSETIRYLGYKTVSNQNELNDSTVNLFEKEIQKLLRFVP